MKLSIRFSGLFTLVNNLKPADPASRGDVLFPDARPFRSTAPKHPQVLPAHDPVLELPSTAIDWKSPLVSKMGSYTGSGGDLQWSLTGSVVSIVAADPGTGATTEISGGVTYDTATPAGPEPKPGEEGNLKWLVSLNALGPPKRLVLHAGLDQGSVKAPVLCRVALRAGRLDAAELFEDKAGAKILFVAVNGNDATPTAFEQALASALLWWHVFASGGNTTPALRLESEVSSATIPLDGTATDILAKIWSEPRNSPPSKGRADHLLATYLLAEPRLPDVDLLVPREKPRSASKAHILHLGGTHCPPDQLP